MFTQSVDEWIVLISFILAVPILLWIAGMGAQSFQYRRTIKRELLRQILDDRKVIAELLRRNTKTIKTCKDLDETRLDPRDLRILRVQIVAQMPVRFVHWFDTEVKLIIESVEEQEEQLAILKKLPWASESEWKKMTLNECYRVADKFASIRTALEQEDRRLSRLKRGAAKKRAEITPEALTNHCDAADEMFALVSSEAFGFESFKQAVDVQQTASFGRFRVMYVRRLIADADLQRAYAILSDEIWPLECELEFVVRAREDAKNAVLLDLHRVRVELLHAKEEVAAGRAFNPKRTGELIVEIGKDFETWVAGPEVRMLSRLERQQALDFFRVRIMSAFLYGSIDAPKETRQFAKVNS